MAQFGQEQITINALALYLDTILGVAINAREWSEQGKLPYYLHDHYSFAEITLLGRDCVALVEKHLSTGESPAVRKHIDFLRKSHNRSFLFVTAALAAHDRKRLIEQQVQFIVPGNQLFIPEFGMDLREQFKARREKIEVMGPATQAMLIRQLCSPWDHSLQTDDLTMGKGYGGLNQEFKYSRMTLSRSVKELENLELISLVDNLINQRSGKPTKDIAFKMSSTELWKKSRQSMKSPVKKVVYLTKIPDIGPEKLLLAGESALAMLAKDTMLAEPKLPVYAMSYDRYRALREAKRIREERRDEAACEVQIWLYEPMEIWKWSPCVDVFSLIQSFKDEQDPRLQMCVEEIEAMVA
jgi:hypothetical protein